MAARWVWMTWKRAGASISLSMMNFHTFLLSCFTCAITRNICQGAVSDIGALTQGRHFQYAFDLNAGVPTYFCKIHFST